MSSNDREGRFWIVFFLVLIGMLSFAVSSLSMRSGVAIEALKARVTELEAAARK